MADEDFNDGNNQQDAEFNQVLTQVKQHAFQPPLPEPEPSAAPVDKSAAADTSNFLFLKLLKK